MKLTEIECDVMLHRLESDVLPEVLDMYPEDLVRGHVAWAMHHIKTHKELPKIESDVMRDVIQDCIEGSTYFPYHKTAKSLSRKVSEHIGIEVKFPGW